MKNELIVLLGPTASGKTELALRLAHAIDGEVVSADSRQVDTEMHIGTAKPRSAWRDATHDVLTPDPIHGVNHYLLNIRRPDKILSLAEWQAAAFAALDVICSAGTTPLLVGGTMLYVDSIVFNYAIPNVSRNASLRDALSQQSTEQLYHKLLALDPGAQTFVDPHNTRRIVRALEVIEATGQPFSSLRQQRDPRYTTTLIGLFPGWEALEESISVRAQEMLAAGLVAERDRLIERYGADLPLLETINYQQAPDINAMVRATMRYARRQMSWWRGRRDIRWFTRPEDVSVADLQLPAD